MTKYYVIYTRWLATSLRNQGFPIIKVEANPNKPEFDCYFFEETDDFKQALNKLTKKS